MRRLMILWAVLTMLSVPFADAEVKVQMLDDGSVALENSLLRITVNPVGARISGLYDKVRGREQVKMLAYVGGVNDVRYGNALNLDDSRDRYALSIVDDGQGGHVASAVARVVPTQEKPASATVRKTYRLLEGSTRIAVSLRISNDGAEEIAFIPWVRHLLSRGLKRQPEEAHMTEYGAYLSGQPIPGKPHLSPRADWHHFPAAHWTTSLLAPGEENANVFATVLKPEDMLKLYYWHRPLEDFATQEVIAAPLFVAPGASKQWEYCFAVAAPVRNIVYVSPQILIGATPHPQGIAGETKEMNLAFAATQTLDGVRAAGRIVSVADPARVLNQFSLDLPGLNPRDIVTRSVPVTLEKNASLLLRLSFTRHLKEWHPGEDVNDREDVVIPVVVGISHPGEVVYRDRTRRDSRLRQVQPRALKAVQMHESEAFDAFAYPPGDRCFRRDTLQASTQGPARLYACAGEYESVQIVLVPKPGRDAVYAVDRGELLGPDGARIQCESVNEFLYVPTRMPSGYNARLGVGEFPEALLPVSDVALKGDGAHPLFVTYRVPPEAKPGLYRGAVLLSSGGARHALPVEMTVWNIPMPQRSRWMDTPASLKGDAFVGAVPRDKDGIALGRQEQSRLIVDMHLKYRLTPCDAGLARYLLALDFDAFEPEMRRYIGAGATRIYLGSAQAILKGHADTLPVIEKYLREKGWIDHFYVRPGFDEASTELLPQIRAVCEAWKKVSSIPLMETYYHDKPEGLYGMLDIYCRGVSDAPWIRQRLAAGDRFWKVNAFPNALEPAPWIIRRSYLSFFDYAFTGTYLWTVKQWTGVAKWGEDYWCDGGVGNLAAVLMWPHETGILSTIRLEALRDAIEDNALFWMLREKVASLEGTPETQALNTARALVAAPLAQDVHTLDQLDSLRRAAGDLLSALNTAHPHK